MQGRSYNIDIRLTLAIGEGGAFDLDRCSVTVDVAAVVITEVAVLHADKTSQLANDHT